MLRGDAESLAGRGVRFEPADPLADRQRLRDLVVIGQQFSPSVAIDPGDAPDGLLLDATGCGFGRSGEAGFAANLLDEVRQRGYWAVAATADTVGAAWAVARYGLVRRLFVPDTRSRVMVVPPGGQLDALRPLPVAALRPPVGVAEVLGELNVVRVDQLLALPRDQLPARFGAELLGCIDRALGIVPEGLTGEPAVEPLEARRAFEPPITDAQVLGNVIEKLIGRLLKEVRGQDVGFRKLLWWLRVEGHDQVCVPVELLRPTAHARELSDLVRLQLDRLRLPGEVTEVTVRAVVVARLVYRQGDLFGGRCGANGSEDVTGLIERLSSRLGSAAVLRPRLVADAQPELAFRFDPWLTADDEKERNEIPGSPSLTRPICLWATPEPVQVMSATTDGPPAWLKCSDREYTIERAWGPERVETGWWRGADVRRDYYTVETTDGERFWLFRDLTGGGWFLHGVYE
jgi:protein ImuB